MRVAVLCCLLVLSYDRTTARVIQGVRGGSVPKRCRPVYCRMYCPGGYARNSQGCPTCVCRDPCKDHKWPPPSRCLFTTWRCTHAPCPRLPVCGVSREHSRRDDVGHRMKRRATLHHLPGPIAPLPKPWLPGPHMPIPLPRPRPGGLPPYPDPWLPYEPWERAA